ncbi:MAG: restriction endonuclease subunit S [Blautia massiliensis (ex Durand et al. 2017)]
MENCGIKGKTDKPAKVFPANTITVDFWGNAYYRDFNYKLATHNHVFSLSGDVIKNRLVGLYIVGMLSKLPGLFSYDNMATWNKLKSLEIKLPVTSAGNIDFDYMERYIRALEKLTIADAVKYKDKVIVTTKRALGV